MRSLPHFLFRVYAPVYINWQMEHLCRIAHSSISSYWIIEIDFIFVLLQSVTLPDGKYTVPTKVCTTIKSPEFTPTGVRVTRSLVWCVCFVDRCLSFYTFLLAIMLSVLQYTDSDYPFGIFKIFLQWSMGVDSEKEESQDCVSIILTTCWRQNNKEKTREI